MRPAAEGVAPHDPRRNRSPLPPEMSRVLAIIGPSRSGIQGHPDTVLAAKEFLDGEIKKAEDLDHVDKSIKVIFQTNSQFQQVKKDGVGQTTLLKFLGGNWKQWRTRADL